MRFFILTTVPFWFVLISILIILSVGRDLLVVNIVGRKPTTVLLMSINRGQMKYWEVCNMINLCLKKKLTLLNSLPNKKCETFSGNFYINGWLKIMIPTNLKIIHAWVSTGHFCKGYEN